MVKSDRQSVAEKNTHPVTRRIDKRKLLFFVVGGILVITILVYGASIYYGRSAGDTASNKPEEAEKPLTKQETLRNELIDSIVIGGQVQTALEGALGAAEGDEQRADLYLQAAAYAYSADGATQEAKEQALLNAEKSYELHKTGAAAKMVLDMAADLNRQDLVAKYQPVFDAYIKDIIDLRQGSSE